MFYHPFTHTTRYDPKSYFSHVMRERASRSLTTMIADSNRSLQKRNRSVHSLDVFGLESERPGERVLASRSYNVWSAHAPD